MSEAQAYDIRSQADQDALDQEQRRQTQVRQDEIMLRETAQQSAIYLERLKKTAPWVAGITVFVLGSLAVAIAVVTVGNASANVIRQHAKAVEQFRLAAEVHPDATGALPNLVLPKGVQVRVLDAATQSVLDSGVDHRATAPQLQARNELYVRAAAQKRLDERGVEWPIQAAPITAEPVLATPMKRLEGGRR